jgi:hypothetical protein
VHITGHGNIVFTRRKQKTYANIFIAGGFLLISDNYGLNPYDAAAEEKSFFRRLDFVEAAFFRNPIYHQKVWTSPTVFLIILQHDYNNGTRFWI